MIAPSIGTDVSHRGALVVARTINSNVVSNGLYFITIHFMRAASKTIPFSLLAPIAMLFTYPFMKVASCFVS